MPIDGTRMQRRLLVALILLASLAARVEARPPAEAGLDVVSSHLAATRALARRRAPLDRAAAADPVLRLRDGGLEIELRFRRLDPQTVARIRALGVEIVHVSYRYHRVSGLADPDLLPALAALPGVATIHPSYGAQRNRGVVAAQGDAAVHADVARERFGVDGSGVRIGILSDSFSRHLGGTVTGAGCARVLAGSTPQVSGDLPAEVAVLDDGPTIAFDEGAAMAEIVHDIAPGSALLFGSAFPDEAAFAESIDALTACGADILVDDVIYYAEPMFQDGIIAHAAQAAVDAGVPFFSSAGNQAEGGVEAAYRDAAPDVDDPTGMPTGDDFHDFGDTRFAAITVPGHCSVRLVLQWDEPFSGTLGAGASSDLDLYVVADQSPSADVVASGTDPQGCASEGGGPSGDPLEIAVYSNRSRSPHTVYAAIDHFCGRPDARFRLVTFRDGCVLRGGYAFDPAVFTGAQIYGHPAAAGVVAVAAAFYAEIDSGGNAMEPAGTIDVEPFSARGGELAIAFDGAGVPLPGGPVRRFKPELAAPDGVNTTFFGFDSPADPDSFPNFFGTSAAAPHVAAVAALLREAHSTLTPGSLTDILRRTAADIAAEGRDVRAGDGLIDAARALALALATPTPTPSPTPTRTPALPGDCTGDGRVTVDEAIRAVRIALGEAGLSTCAAADRNGDGRITIDELLQTVAAALASTSSGRGLT